MSNLHAIDELVHIFYRNVHKFVPFLDCPRVSQNDTSAALRVLNTAFYDTSAHHIGERLGAPVGVSGGHLDVGVAEYGHAFVFAGS